ncbi:MAG: hypothetical protein M3065_05670 [Actinomycetota bacterium]|nr:hypothetical protein [Actinomycetota bacterium]
MSSVSQQEVIEALLARSRRDAVPIRRSFTQLRSRGGGPGPLAAFLTGRRRRALDLYLLAHAICSAPPWDVTLESVVWGRLLGLSGSGLASMITRQWNWLEEQQLIATSRKDRLRMVTLLREDGSGQPYAHPGLPNDDQPPEGDYFSLPHAYWRMGLQDQVDLPTKTVLIIALSRPDNFILPLEQAAKWYGFSPDSVRTGLRQLQVRDLLDVEFIHTKAPLSPTMVRTERRYTLRPPFGPRSRDEPSDPPLR